VYDEAETPVPFALLLCCFVLRVKQKPPSPLLCCFVAWSLRASGGAETPVPFALLLCCLVASCFTFSFGETKDLTIYSKNSNQMSAMRKTSPGETKSKEEFK